MDGWMGFKTWYFGTWITINKIGCGFAFLLFFFLLFFLSSFPLVFVSVLHATYLGNQLRRLIQATNIAVQIYEMISIFVFISSLRL